MKERGEAGDRREEMVRRLVEAAGIVIDRNGCAAASTLEIVRQAGASRGALYHHFQSKRQLGDAVLYCQRRFFEQVSEQAWAGPAPQVWLQTLIDISHHYTVGILDDPVLRAAVRLSIEPGPYQSAESSAVPESARVADELQDYVQPAEAARTLVGCYSGIQLLALALAEGDGLHAQVTAMWRMCMPGIARKNILTRLRLGPPGSGRPSLPGARP
ncbi:TetR/AcrR family transcriptional regulator [Streptomyces griseus]|uniref:TetR/AcrR family transcriptional regulator n=1 Tax=Streptomyces griseus TaxID=1911 RepID=UPI000849BFF0|nr:TetR/AcrR family transcriptional regulator [Streptomyces griseus]MBW3709635.1 TetR/AcrR family transcriptional regulator [Streptomyces griseus]SEE25166.1 DNA-binding transcriptional regulator, AcrR family [Streptomyces griseus]SQA27340.1 A-factor receptor protein [Streptomyces griseus]